MKRLYRKDLDWLNWVSLSIDLAKGVSPKKEEVKFYLI